MADVFGQLAKVLVRLPVGKSFVVDGTNNGTISSAVGVMQSV